MTDQNGVFVDLSKKQKILFHGLLPHHQIALLAHLNGSVLRDEVWSALTDCVILDTMDCYTQDLYCNITLQESLDTLQSRIHFGEQLYDVLLYDGYVLQDDVYRMLFALAALPPQKLFITGVIPK